MQGVFWHAERVAPEALVAATYVLRPGGTGLGVRWLLAEDGARQATEFYDVERSHPCVPLAVDDGGYRCLHQRSPQSNAYADPACEEPLASPGALAGSGRPLCGEGDPTVALSWPEGANGAELRWLDEPGTLENVYSRSLNGCTAVAATVPLTGYHRVGEVAAPAEFSPVFETHYGAATLRPRRWSTEPGDTAAVGDTAELAAGISFHDAVRGVECFAAKLSGRDGMRCAPYREGNAWSNVFSDARCTQPLLRALSLGTDTLAALWEPHTCLAEQPRLVDVFERGAPYKGPIFQEVGSECLDRGEAAEGDYLLRGRSVLRRLPELVERRGR